MESKKEQTVAEKIAAMLGDDGTCWETEDGRKLMDILKAEAVTRDHQEGTDADGPTKWIFADDSGIITAGACWDLALEPALDGCHCMAGAGHTPDCSKNG